VPAKDVEVVNVVLETQLNLLQLTVPPAPFHLTPVLSVTQGSNWFQVNASNARMMTVVLVTPKNPRPQIAQLALTITEVATSAILGLRCIIINAHSALKISVAMEKALLLKPPIVQHARKTIAAVLSV